MFIEKFFKELSEHTKVILVSLAIIGPPFIWGLVDYLQEKYRWNRGICRKCGTPWKESPYVSRYCKHFVCNCGELLLVDSSRAYRWREK